MLSTEMENKIFRNPDKLWAVLILISLCLSLFACNPEDSVHSVPNTAPSQTIQSSEDEVYVTSVLETALTEAHTEASSSLQTDPPTVQVQESDPYDVYDSTGFVSVSRLIPDAVIDMRYFSDYNFVGEVIDGYEANCALLTYEAALALQAAGEDFRSQGLLLKVFDAYRPQSAVDHFYSWSLDMTDTKMKSEFYPDIDKSQLYSQGYIAYRSGHSRGSTIDLTLVDMATGQELDMGGEFDLFDESSSYYYSYGLSSEQVANRQLLRSVMTSHGFTAYDAEWWHFSLSDEPYPYTYFDFPVTKLN